VIPLSQDIRRVTLTTVVGVQGKTFCILAADSQITEDNLRTISLKTPKIIEKGQYLIAITGDTRPGDILTYNWNPPAYKGQDEVQFMGKRVIPSIIKTFTDNGYGWNDSDKDKEAGFDYLIAFNGFIFHIASDMSFIQSEGNYYGIGSGGQFALGYMYSRRSDKFLVQDEAAELAQKAVETASLLDINTCPPIQIAVQKRKMK
jgi:ATP-dependent protease HslVU (ClpYQ) peptidase subunit